MKSRRTAAAKSLPSWSKTHSQWNTGRCCFVWIRMGRKGSEFRVQEKEFEWQASRWTYLKSQPSKSQTNFNDQCSKRGVSRSEMEQASCVSSGDGFSWNLVFEICLRFEL